MKAGIRPYLTFSLGLLICVLIFGVDIELPLGVAIWLAYLALVAAAGWFGGRVTTFWLAIVASVLTVFGYFLSPPGSMPWIAALNRGAGILLIWAAAFLITGRRQLLAQVVEQAEALAKANSGLEEQARKLNRANETLATQAAELITANETLMAQAEEVTTANQLLAAQARRSKDANEALQAQAEALGRANDILQKQSVQLSNANELLQNQAEELESQAEELQAQNEELLTLTEALDKAVQERTAELSEANQSLLAMSTKLTAVQENERRIISQELHDESGQLLTTIMIRLGLLADLWKRGESPVEAIAELKQTAVQLAEGLHRLAVSLRPVSLDRAGLAAALEQYLESYHKTYNLRVDLLVEGLDHSRLSPDLESTIYRIIQEALTNVARHAAATHVGVVLNQRSDRIVAIVEDNGIGFDVEEAERKGRLGLTGMLERAEMRGGTLTIESQPGAGTTIYLEMPCVANAIAAG